MSTMPPPRPRRRKRRTRPLALTPERKALAEQYLPMALALAWPLKRGWPQHADEFDSAAWLALVQAAGVYEPDRHVKFSTFARRRIIGALKDVHRYYAIERVRVENGRLPSTCFNYNPRFEGILAPPARLGTRGKSCYDEPPVGHAMESSEAFEGLIAQLPPRNADVCRLIYVEEMNQQEAAARLGMSQSRFSYLHRESLAILNGSWSEWVVARGGRHRANDANARDNEADSHNDNSGDNNGNDPECQ
jgi:RNA polymerase sigma factor (sigma-70 family)